MRRSPKSHLITDAERSPEEELRSREIRYVLMMAIRAVAIITAAILVMQQVPWLPLWLLLCVAAAVVLPWAAVLLANDRRPKPEHRFRNRLPGRNHVPAQPTELLAEPAEAADRAAAPPRIIDVDPGP
jgi:Flp pilus assembly protein TadB